MRPLFILALVVFCMVPCLAQTPVVFVATASHIYQFTADGQQRLASYPVQAVKDLHVTPDGKTLYFTTAFSWEIMKIDIASGTPAGSSGAYTPWIEGFVLAPDGDIIGQLQSRANLVRIPDQPGAAPVNLTASGTASLPSALALGPDGALWVACEPFNTIRRFDPVTGSLLGSIVPFPGASMPYFSDLAFGPDGFLYATVFFGGKAVKIDPSTGAVLASYGGSGSQSLTNPEGLGFTEGGELLVSHLHGVRRFSIQTGEELGDFAPSFNLSGATAMAAAVVPEPSSLIALALGLASLRARRHQGLAHPQQA